MRHWSEVMEEISHAQHQSAVAPGVVPRRHAPRHRLALSESPIPHPGSGEMLVRALYLDVAPDMCGRISPQKNYAGGVNLGEVMIGGGIGEVVHSNSPDYQSGDLVVTDFAFGWQDFAVLSPAVVRRVDPTVAPLPCWLDFLGPNGPTAYFGLVDAAAVKPGDTVVILQRRDQWARLRDKWPSSPGAALSP